MFSNRHYVNTASHSLCGNLHLPVNGKENLSNLYMSRSKEQTILRQSNGVIRH
jgi:hypothetical protein